MLHPVKITEPQVLDQVYALRVKAWLADGINPDSNLEGIWKDEYEERARHWAVLDGEKVLAAARLSIHQSLGDVPSHYVFESLKFEAPTPIASINRLVVHPDGRGLGLSRKLDAIRLQEAKQEGCRTVVAYCLEARVPALERFGFVRVSPLNYRIERPFGPITALALYFTERC